MILCAQSGVMADIPPGQVFMGSPATPAKQQMQYVAATHRLPDMRKQLKRLEKAIEGQAKAADSKSDKNAA